MRNVRRRERKVHIYKGEQGRNEEKEQGCFYIMKIDEQNHDAVCLRLEEVAFSIDAICCARANVGGFAPRVFAPFFRRDTRNRSG
jgi:hypothetical protein